MNVIYVSPELTLPNRMAHSIQILRTCASLVHAGANVTLMARRIHRGFEDYYSFPGITGLKVVHYSYSDLHNQLLGSSDIVLYTRNERVAREIVNDRKFCGVPIFLEIHRKLDFDLSQLSVHDIFQRCFYMYELTERTTWIPEEDIPLLSKVDGIISLYRHVVEIFPPNIQEKCHVLWYGTLLPEDNRRPSLGTGLIFVGQLYPKKGIHLLLHALKEIECHLSIVGGNNVKDIVRLKVLAKHLGVDSKVEWVGHVPPRRVPELLRKHKIAITMTSGLKLAEYMSFGRAIVCPNLRSTQEVLSPDFDACFYDPFSPISLAKQVNRLLRDTSITNSIADQAFKTAEALEWRFRGQRLYQILHKGLR